MAYTRKSWANGEVITAAALNNIEDGIVELKQANTQMSGSVNSSELHIGADTDTIDGKDGNLTVSHKITADELEVKTATFTNTTTFQGAVNVTGSKSSLTVPTPTEGTHASTKQYVDDKETNIKAITIGTGDGLSFSGNLGNSPTLNLTVAAQNKIGGIKVGTNLSIDSNGALSATDTTYSAATATTAGLMSAKDKKKLDEIEAGAKVGTVTGIKINNSDKAPTDGVVDIGNTIVTSIIMNNEPLTITEGAVDLGSVITDVSNKADKESPQFTGTAQFGSENIQINGTQGTVKVGNILFTASNDDYDNESTITFNSGIVFTGHMLLNKLDIPTLPAEDGTYTLQLTLTNGIPTYQWISTGGE